MPETSVPDYLTTADVARITGTSIRTARRWVATGRLKAHKIGTRLLVHPDDLTVALREVPSPAENHGGAA